MSVPFNINGGDEELTKKFLIESWDKGMVVLRTFTAFGVDDYFRASLYNGVILITINSLSILLVKNPHFLVVNFVKETAVYAFN
jgi:phosphoserine aminotransferase